MFLTEYELSHYNKGKTEGINETIQKIYQNGLKPEYISKYLNMPLDKVLIILGINK